MKIKFSELPENLRVKLSDEGEEELWHRVEEFGGVKEVGEAFDFPRSKMYNWKNKDSAMPVKFVRRIMGENSSSEIVELKGPNSGGKIKNPRFPLRVSEELLTRVRCSVKENSEGTPFYITSEKSLADRFTELLEELGEVDHSVYARSSRFEVRYPKFLHQLFLAWEYEEDLAALIDEKGKIAEGKILVDGREIPVEEFDGKLYSREKSFELALQKGDSEKIAELMAEESSKVRKMMED
jgi:hypothetical protein